MRQLLQEVRAIRSRVDSNGDTLTALQEDIKDLGSQLQSLSTRVEKVERSVVEHEDKLKRALSMARKVDWLERSVEDMGNRAR